MASGNNQQGSVPDSIQSAQPAYKRRVFSEIHRVIDPVDLKNPGVQKLLLEMLEQAESEREECRAYVDRFHQADKRSAILEEKQRTFWAIEAFFAIGVSIGSILLANGNIILGLCLIILSILARIIKR